MLHKDRASNLRYPSPRSHSLSGGGSDSFSRRFRLTVSGCLSVWGWAHSTAWMQSLLVRVGVRRRLGWLNAVIAEGPVGTIALRSLLSQGKVKRHDSSALGTVGMHPRLRNLLLTTAALLALGAAPAAAGPAGGTVVGGSATIRGQGGPAVTVNQSSGSAIINWNTFNIGVNESVRFNQPGTS